MRPPRTVAWILALASLAPAVLAPGCAEPRAEAEPPPEAVAPRYEPPPPAEQALDREQVVARSRGLEPDLAIADLDDHPFGFPLDDAALTWFEAQGLPRPVLDYLRKRARVDWRSLRGDVDPERPPPAPPD